MAPVQNTDQNSVVDEWFWRRIEDTTILDRVLNSIQRHSTNRIQIPSDFKKFEIFKIVAVGCIQRPRFCWLTQVGLTSFKRKIITVTACFSLQIFISSHLSLSPKFFPSRQAVPATTKQCSHRHPMPPSTTSNPTIRPISVNLTRFDHPRPLWHQRYVFLLILSYFLGSPSFFLGGIYRKLQIFLHCGLLLSCFIGLDWALIECGFSLFHQKLKFVCPSRFS
jgi:hypothetical protein